VSVRTRFTITVVAIVAATVCLFASLSIVALDRSLRSGFHGRLRSDAEAIATTVDVHNGHISLDANDIRSLAPLHAEASYVIYDRRGNRVAGDSPPISPRSRTVSMAVAPVNREGQAFGNVVVWQSDLWIREFDRDAAIVSLVVGTLLILLGGFVSRRVAARVLAPVAEIASLAEGIEAYDLSARLRADGQDELGRLCASFDRMLDRLQAAFERERRFVADASHELRAPLAVLRGETDLALRRERGNDEYRAALEAISREAVRLELLVDELLAAARAEVDARRQERLDASAIVHELSDRIAPAAARREIDVRVETDGVALACANRATLERALLAIAHNAIEYAYPRGIVRMRSAYRANAVQIEIADDGPGFTTDALAHATERFWRGDAGRPRDGTGLGLAIARTIVEANGGTLQLANSPRGGAIVTVELAAADSSEPHD
jgi:signal transduction histidine kinase